MIRARRVEALVTTTSNEVGTLAQITDALTTFGISILHMGAYVKGERAFFIMVTTDNERVGSLLEDMGYEVESSLMLELEFKNTPGALAPIARKLSDNGIDIEYFFGTSSNGESVKGLASTNDDDMALITINTQ